MYLFSVPKPDPNPILLLPDYITTLKVSSNTSLGLWLKVLMTKMTPFGSSKAFIFSSVNYDMPHLTCLLLDWLQLKVF